MLRVTLVRMLPTNRVITTCCQKRVPVTRSVEATLAPAMKLANCAAMIANPSGETGNIDPAPCIMSERRSKTPVFRGMR